MDRIDFNFISNNISKPIIHFLLSSSFTTKSSSPNQSLSSVKDVSNYTVHQTHHEDDQSSFPPSEVEMNGTLGSFLPSSTMSSSQITQPSPSSSSVHPSSSVSLSSIFNQTMSSIGNNITDHLSSQANSYPTDSIISDGLDDQLFSLSYPSNLFLTSSNNELNYSMMYNVSGNGYWYLNSTSNGSSESFELEEANVFILPWYQQAIWSILFGLMVIIAAGGNAIVIWIVLTHDRMRTVTNYFIVNLSFADIMVSTLNVIFNFVYMLDGHWPFGDAYCKISNFISILSVAASVFTLMAISLDRYSAIMHPLRPRMSRKVTVLIMVIIWIISIILSLPNIIFSTVQVEPFANGDFRVICYMVWPDGPSTASVIEYIYNVIILLVTYMVPIISMSYTYYRVGKELWGSKAIGEVTAKQIESVQSKKKIVKMMIVVVVIFSICWLPYHVYFLLAHHFPEIIASEYVQHVYLTIYFLAMSNSMYNPMIYCWMNGRFRQGFRKVFCCVCFRSREAQIAHEARYHRKPRYSCSEAGNTTLMATDTRLRVNSNGDISLQRIKDGSSGSERKSINSLRSAGHNATTKTIDICTKSSSSPSSTAAVAASGKHKDSISFSRSKCDFSGSKGSLSIKNISPSRLSPSYQPSPKNGSSPIPTSPTLSS